MLKRGIFIGFVFLFFLVLAEGVSAATYYVSLTGSDSTGDGSSGTPWRTITYAVNHIPAAGGDTILVRDGVYNESSYVSRAFNNWVTIKAENRYKVKLTNIQNGVGGVALTIGAIPVASVKVIVEGFEISNDYGAASCSARINFLALIQNVSDVVLRDNIFHGNNAPNACNEILKVNRAGGGCAGNITITGNVFYDPAAISGSDLIDALFICDINITGNIFFSRSAPSSQSFITIKRELPPGDPDLPPVVRNPRFVVNKNVFLNWNGAGDQAFIQFGEDQLAQDMITNSLIENNLMIGNSPASMAAPIQLKGVKNITVRANTIVGNLPSGAYFRVGLEANNLDVQNIYIRNNIFDDPTGTMPILMNTFDSSANGAVILPSFILNNNLYWNNGNSLPTGGSMSYNDDFNGITTNPGITGDQSSLVLPVWDRANSQFQSGSTTIQQEFERLVNTYGAISLNSLARDSADPTNMPAEDILGNTRDAGPDIGAFEYVSGASTPSADVNGDGLVNVIDLALTTYWQGKNNQTSGDWSFFQHLDQDGDGRVGWSDVLRIIAGI